MSDGKTDWKAEMLAAHAREVAADEAEDRELEKWRGVRPELTEARRTMVKDEGFRRDHCPILSPDRQEVVGYHMRHPDGRYIILEVTPVGVERRPGVEIEIEL